MTYEEGKIAVSPPTSRPNFHNPRGDICDDRSTGYSPTGARERPRLLMGVIDISVSRQSRIRSMTGCSVLTIEMLARELTEGCSRLLN